jgi:hypothetical protein
MTRIAMALLVGLILAGSVPAQSPSRPDDQGTFLGVLFSPVPEALYDQLPQVPRHQGVLVTHVLHDSPAARADLRRHDILLRYDQEKIRDCEHLARLIQADRPNHKVKLALVRAGRPATLEATLCLGPALKIAPAARTGPGAPSPVARGVAKPGGLPSVSVAATPLGDGRMRVTIEYYQEGTGRLRTIACEGRTAEIDREVRSLPRRERKLAEVALAHIRALNSQKK